MLLLRKDDLPQDGKLLWRRQEADCKLLEYSSRKLRKAFDGGLDKVLVALTSPLDQPYSPGAVESAILMIGTRDREVSC